MTIRVDRVLSPPGFLASGEYCAEMGRWTSEEAARKSYQVPAGRLRMAKKSLLATKKDQKHASQKNYHTVRPCATLLQPTPSHPPQGVPQSPGGSLEFRRDVPWVQLDNIDLAGSNPELQH